MQETHLRCHTRVRRFCILLTITTDYDNSSKETIKLSANAKFDQNFTHAAFNDTGDLLFAWAYGQVDKLYCWRCEDGVLQQAPESESPYETVR